MGQETIAEDHTLTSDMAELVQEIEHACCETAADMPCNVGKALVRFEKDARIIALACRAPSDATYTRHLLYADACGRFSIVALAWQRGQQTPVHAHYTWCAYKVLHGVLHEEQYIHTPGSDEVRLNRTVKRLAGESACSHGGFEQIHRLGNRDPETAVSLHVYGIDGDRVATHVNRLVQAQ